MAELVVIGFDSPNEADRVLTELGRLQKEYLVDLEDAVVAIRDENGKLRLKQSVPLAKIGAASGGMWGSLWGSLVGLLFLNPLLGLVSGGLLGAGAGALSGRTCPITGSTTNSSAPLAPRCVKAIRRCSCWCARHSRRRCWPNCPTIRAG